MISNSVDYTTSELIWKHNFGYTLEPIDQIKLTSGRARLMFHYDLPVFTGHFGRNIPHRTTCRQTDRRELELCGHLRDITIELATVKRDLLHLQRGRMLEIQELLEEIRQRRTRTTRSIFSWIGQGIADAFDLSTKEDLEKVQDLMKRVLSGTQRAVETWKDGQNMFTRVTRLNNDRFQNMDALLNWTRLISILQEQNRLNRLTLDNKAYVRFRRGRKFVVLVVGGRAAS